MFKSSSDLPGISEGEDAQNSGRSQLTSSGRFMSSLSEEKMFLRPILRMMNNLTATNVDTTATHIQEAISAASSMSFSQQSAIWHEFMSALFQLAASADQNFSPLNVTMCFRFATQPNAAATACMRNTDGELCAFSDLVLSFYATEQVRLSKKEDTNEEILERNRSKILSIVKFIAELVKKMKVISNPGKALLPSIQSYLIDSHYPCKV
eukprot:TRINITY_DN18720_c0_g1_i1.p1 TRINITY_DN18720_c0_g1~~TRINITY_DN18720_c0_g1_i1.p1  ORF type:complete len:209 (+),score=45.63 TRINITY_DN18720_c0_g1_i1:84-710(+)